MRARSGLSAVAVIRLVAVAVVVGVLAVVVIPRLGSIIRPDIPLAGRANWAPPVQQVAPTPAPTVAAPGIAALVDASWAADVSGATGISKRAVLAYAGAALQKQVGDPGCRLSWTTLAAIGNTESGNGTHGGSSVGADGTVSPPIFGVALNGNGTALIRDSDGGAIDGDAAADRAVGPMQIIPQTWRNWHADGNADGVENPQNLDDSVVAMSNYLCRASTALNTETGWRAAIAAYNSADSYLTKVAATANRYNAEVTSVAR